MSFRIATTGHRKLPPGVDDYVYGWLKDQLENAKGIHGSVTAISGMAINTDQLFARAAIEVGATLIAAIPFARQADVWPAHMRRQYFELLDKCEIIYYVDTLDDYMIPGVKDGIYDKRKYKMRDQWMVDNADIVLGVFDRRRTRSGTAMTLNMAKKQKKQGLVLYLDKLQELMARKKNG